MPKVKVTKEGVLNAAAEVVRKGGNLNVRAVAEELGCSTQPIYSLFKGMEELKSALIEEGKARYKEFIEEFCLKAGRSRYECYGMGYVKFAREEKGLFRYLFLRESEKASDRPEDPYWEEIISEMMTLYKMDEETANAFHRDMAVFSYGLAILVNLGGLSLSDEEVSLALKREFYGLYAVHVYSRGAGMGPPSA